MKTVSVKTTAFMENAVLTAELIGTDCVAIEWRNWTLFLHPKNPSVFIDEISKDVDNTVLFLQSMDYNEARIDQFFALSD